MLHATRAVDVEKESDQNLEFQIYHCMFTLLSSFQILLNCSLVESVYLKIKTQFCPEIGAVSVGDTVTIWGRVKQRHELVANRASWGLHCV